MFEFTLIFAGFLVGAVVGLTGVGGGSLMTPLLIFGFGVKPYLAVGTDLLFAAATKFSGSVYAAQTRLIQWRIVFFLSAGSVPAALITIAMIEHFGKTSAAVQTGITTTLGVALVLTAIATLYKTWEGAWSPNSKPSIPKTRQTASAPSLSTATGPKNGLGEKHWGLTVLLGTILGALVALTSVGAGAIGVMVLILLYPRLPLMQIVAIDIAYAVPLTLVAGLGHAAIGAVNWNMLGFLLLGSIPGVLLGLHWGSKAPQRLTRSLLSLFLTGIGIKLISF